jgi:hypothetical protein
VPRVVEARVRQERKGWQQNPAPATHPVQGVGPEEADAADDHSRFLIPVLKAKLRSGASQGRPKLARLRKMQKMFQ